MQPNLNTPLNQIYQIQEALEQAGYVVEAQVDKRLKVSLDAGLSLMVYYQEDQLLLAEQANSALAQELTTPDSSLTLCLSLERDCDLPTERLLDLYRLLNVWNGMLPLGAFGVNESQPSGMLYHYALLHDQSFNPLLVAEMLEQISFYLSRLIPLLEGWLISGGDLEGLMTSAEETLALDSLTQLQRESLGN